MFHSPTNAAENAIAEQASRWLARLNSKDAGEEERAAFAEWLAQSPQHRLEFDRVQALWNDMEPLRNHPSVIAELQAARPALRRVMFNLTMRFSFAGFAVVLLCWIAFQLLPPEFDAMREIHTARGEIKTIALEDGSVIEMDADSTISLQTGANSYRIRLKQGNAFFTVAHRPLRTFEVYVGHGIARDIGTRFGVSIEGNIPVVGVLDGEVEVKNSRLAFLPIGQAKRLMAGQRAALLESGKIDFLSGDLDAQYAWRAGQLVFDRTSLAEAVQRISRYHDAKIMVDAEAGALQLSGTFKTNDLQAFLWGIRQIHPLVVNNSDGHIHISAVPPLYIPNIAR
ncbi:MAG: FecR domain-containing protein [Candidatus Ferrigenium altingense]|jgi:transmembrane sensor